MRNYLTLALSLLIVSSPALASRARLESLGESPNGSLYINDIENTLYNPAFVNDYKKKLMLELGNDSYATADSVANSKAQAEFINTFGDFTYAIELNHMDSRVNASIMTAPTFLGATNVNFLVPDNSVEVMFGGDAGVKWGVSAMYAGNQGYDSTTNDTGGKQTAHIAAINAGIVSGNTQVFADVAFAGDAKGTSGTTGNINDEVKGKVAVDAGATYNMDNWTALAKFTDNGIEYDKNAVNQGTVSNMTIEGGFGYKKDVTKAVNLFSRLEFAWGNTSLSPTGLSSYSGSSTWNIPLTIGAEAQALSWLAVRGSIAQALMGQTKTANINSLNNTTQIAAGVGMTFGDLVIDGLVATGGAGNAGTQVGFGGSNAATNTTWGFGNAMLTRISLTYNF